MTPSKELLITTLEGILLSITNMISNLKDDGLITDDDGETYEDFKDLQDSEEKLRRLIIDLENK